MKKINIKDSINLYELKADKFKTFMVSFYFQRPLSEDEVSLNALIPYVLKQGSKNYPDNKAISKTLEELYGGTFDCVVRKKGDTQIIGFVFEFLSPRYVKNPAYKKNIYEFMYDVIFNPLVSDGGFLKDYTEREKKNQIEYVKGIINDKKEYASIRCVEEMFKGEPYALFTGGSVEGIEKADPKSLFKQYEKLVKSSPVDVFVSGDVDTVEIRKILEKAERVNPEGRYPVCSYKKHEGEVKKITDNMNVTQGKLTMGFVTNVTTGTKESAALTVFNSIFGSGSHSKLFNNVREKLSLCYYASSRLNKLKGTMTVSSGVEFKNFDKAYDEILKQLENIRKGEISDWEMKSSKSFLVNILSSYDDSMAATEEFYFNQALTGENSAVTDFIELIKEITLEDVVSVANKIELDTVYKLSGDGRDE